MKKEITSEGAEFSRVVVDLRSANFHCGSFSERVPAGDKRRTNRRKVCFSICLIIFHSIPILIFENPSCFHGDSCLAVTTRRLPPLQGVGLGHGAPSGGDGAETEGARGPPAGRPGAEAGEGSAGSSGSGEQLCIVWTAGEHRPNTSCSLRAANTLIM